eukprot:403374769
MVSSQNISRLDVVRMQHLQLDDQHSNVFFHKRESRDVLSVKNSSNSIHNLRSPACIIREGMPEIYQIKDQANMAKKNKANSGYLLFDKQGNSLVSLPSINHQIVPTSNQPTQANLRCYSSFLGEAEPNISKIASKFEQQKNQKQKNNYQQQKDFQAKKHALDQSTQKKFQSNDLKDYQQPQRVASLFKSPMSNFIDQRKKKKSLKTLEQITLDIINQSANQLRKQKKQSEIDIFTDSDSDEDSFELHPIHHNLEIPIQPDYLPYHSIKPINRMKMIDWMIQVFRVLKRSSPQTFFLAVTLMDRFFLKKQELKEPLDSIELHETGLVCIHISSKFEDVIPIYMTQILNDAAHKKFTRDQILIREKQILSTLDFNIMDKNIYEESMILIKNSLSNFKQTKLSKRDIDCIMEYLLFLCQLTVHSYDICRYDTNALALTLVYLSVKFLKKFYVRQIAKRDKQELNNPNDHDNYQNLLDLRAFIRYIKLTHISSSLFSIKSLQSKVINHLQNFKEHKLLNLDRNYPQFMRQKSLDIFSIKYDLY